MFLVFGCSKPNAHDESAADTTKLSEQDSLVATNESSVEEFGYAADYYLVNKSLDPSEFQLIDKSCVILIEATKAQVQAQDEQRAIEQAEQHAQWEQAKAEWEKQPHDTSEQFDGEENYGTDDGMYYQWQAQQTFDELKIDTITISKKGYVKLIDKNNKEWLLDIRSKMTPEWTIILFNVNKEPKVVEAIDVTRERMIQYFF